MRRRLSLKWLIAAAAGALSPTACHDDRVTLGKGGTHDGGSPDATAEASGWIDRTPCVVPAPFPSYRVSPMTVFDSDRRKLIVYGDQTSTSDPLTDLWELDIATSVWTDRTACGAVQPPPTTSGQLVYDHTRRRVIMFSGTAGQVWEWDPTGPGWTSRPAPAGSPAPTTEAVGAIADDARGKILVFTNPWRNQGPVIVGSLSLWEWDGASGTWQLRIDDGLPWATIDRLPAMTLDPQSGAVWFFAARRDPDDRLWRLDPASATLTDLTPPVRPAAWPPTRGGADFATDRARGRLVVFGGRHVDLQRDLWELDPATVTWTNRTPPNVPVTGAALPDGVVWPTATTPETGAFGDATSGRILRLTGLDLIQTGDAPSLWAWDGAAGTWSPRMPEATAPRWPSRSGFRLLSTWDSDLDKVIVYAPESRELWQWDSATGRWDRLTPAGVVGWITTTVDPVPWPSARQDSAIAYDPGVRRVVIFGGNELVATGRLNDLWLWDPATQQMTSSPRSGASWPAPRSEHAMAYDPMRRRLVLFGGALPEASAELWALDTGAGAWERIEPNGSWPAARAHHTLVLDEARQVLVLQGGLPAPMGSGQILFDYGFFDTWELPAGASTWKPPAPGMATLRWPSAWTPPPLAYVRGVGVVALALPLGKLASALALWRWEPKAAAWVATGIEVPRSDSLLRAAVPELAGGGDAMLMLVSGATDRPVQDRGFAETWEWKAP